MTSDELLDLLKHGGVTVGMLVGLVWLLVRLLGGSIRDAVVKFFATLLKTQEEIRDAIKQHREADIAVEKRIIELHGKLDGILDERERTPVEVPLPVRRERTPAKGYYGPRKPTKDGDQ